MKLDKETIAKQRFWFLLPLGLVLIFLALGSVWGIRSEASRTVEEIEQAYKQVSTGAPVVVSDQLIKMLQEQEQRALSLKESLWEELFRLQNDVEIEGELRLIRQPLIIWPDDDNLKNFQQQDFGTPFPRSFPHQRFRNEFPKLYEQLLGILPLYDEKTGRGAVRANPWVRLPGRPGDEGNPRGFDQGRVNLAATTRDLMLAVLEPPTLRHEGDLTTDEIWTALEDVAVKRELLRSLASVLDNFALLKPEFQPLADWDADEHKPGEKPSDKPGKPAFGIGDSGPPRTVPPGQAEASRDGAKPGLGSDSTKPSEKAQTKPSATATPRKEITRRRFYNTAWHFETLDELANVKDANHPLPVLGREEGWLLDIRVTADEKQPGVYYLEIISANYSPRFAIPKMPVRVWFETSQGKRFRVDVPDVGSVPKASVASQPQGSQALPNQVPLYKSPSRRQIEVQFRWPSDNSGQQPDAKDLPDFILGIQRQPPQSALDYQRLANSHWIADVELRRAKDGLGYQLSGLLYNRSGRRQAPPAFQVEVSDGAEHIEQRVVQFGKEVLDSYKGAKFEETLRLAQRPAHIVSIKQVLDWQTTPIKRVDVIRIGEGALVQADRIWTVRLQFYPFLLKKGGNQQDILSYSDPIVDRAGGGRGGGGTPSPQPGGPGFQPGAGTGPMGDAGPGAGQVQRGADVSPSGIPLRRYFPSNPAEAGDVPTQLPEVRRLPVAMVLITDHSAIADVLLALANSRLRIQVTQAVWARTPPLGPPFAPQDTKPGAAGQPGEGPDGGASSPPVTDVPGSEAAELNLVELQVYGLASLYENPYVRYQYEQGTDSGGPGGFRPGPPGGGRSVEFRPSGRDWRERGAPFGGRRGYRGRR